MVAVRARAHEGEGYTAIGKAAPRFAQRGLLGGVVLSVLTNESIDERAVGKPTDQGFKDQESRIPHKFSKQYSSQIFHGVLAQRNPILRE